MNKLKTPQQKANEQYARESIKPMYAFIIVLFAFLITAILQNQTEADTKGITLSKLVYKILKQYEQTNLSRETTEVAQKSNNATRVTKTSTGKAKSI